MAVERLTDYTRRIWTALDADAPEDHDIQVGDVIYYMDSSTCGIVTYVYPDGSIDCETLPDIGGGGGGGYTVADVTMLSHKTSSDSSNFIIAVDNLDGVFPTNNSILRTDTPYPVTNMVIQNGFFAMRNQYPATRVVYNGVTLDTTTVDVYTIVPYVGNDYAYELFFD